MGVRPNGSQTQKGLNDAYRVLCRLREGEQVRQGLGPQVPALRAQDLLQEEGPGHHAVPGSVKARHCCLASAALVALSCEGVTHHVASCLTMQRGSQVYKCDSYLIV